MIRRNALVAALALVAGTASAQYYDSRRDGGIRGESGPRWDTARVVNVDPILAPGEPRYRQQCWQEPVRYLSRGRGYNDDHRYARQAGPGSATSTVLGGIVGAAVGRQFGDGDGRRAATVAGALLGGAIANDRSRQRYDNGYGRDVVRETVRYEQRCETIADGRAEDRVVGYRVAYDYNGLVYSTETPYHPGDTIRVRVDVVPEI
ncbi:glycine zipper 2TM domain-containing protein [Silanimonas algicola]